MEYRTEHDSMGEVRVPADRYWGAQTERSRNHFQIGMGKEPMPKEIVEAFGILKKAAALANLELRPEKMTKEKSLQPPYFLRKKHHLTCVTSMHHVDLQWTLQIQKY